MSSQQLRVLRVILIATVVILSGTYGWLTYEASAARKVLATAEVDRSVAESLAAVHRVRLALERVRRLPYDSATLHLSVRRQDGTVTLERAGTTLVQTMVQVAWPVGIDTIATVAPDTIRSTKGTVVTTDRVTSPVEFRAITRSLMPGALIYVQ